MGGITPVAPYAKLDSTSQTGTAYKTAIDANSVAAMRMVGRFLPHAQASPNMTIMLDAGSLFDGVTLTEVTAQNTPTLVAPVSHPRIDRVVIDNATGSLSVVPGAEAVSPAAPAIPAGKSPVAQVKLQTTATAISNSDITDERNFSALAPGGFGAQTNASSATTCNIGSILSHNVKITGTTTIASFGSSAVLTAPIYLVEFAAALTLTNSASLVCIGGANILTAAGDTAVFEYVGSGNWRMRSYSKASGVPLVYPVGSIVNRAYIDTADQASITAVIPSDGTPPQITEGYQILETTYAPQSTTNILRVTVIMNGSSTIASSFAAAVFQNSVPDAFLVAGTTVPATYMANCIGMIEFVPGSTSPIDFTVRVGTNNAGFLLNSGLYGGTRSSLLIEEIKA